MTVYQGEKKKYIIQITDAGGVPVSVDLLDNLKIWIYIKETGVEFQKFALVTEEDFDPIEVVDGKAVIYFDQSELEASGYVDMQVTLYTQFDDGKPNVCTKKGLINIYREAKT